MDKREEQFQTITLETASKLYDVKLSNLRKYCLQGILPSVKVGKCRYVTPEAMDAVFKPAKGRKP